MSGPPKDVRRNIEIVRRCNAGESAPNIAYAYSLSVPRIYQILTKAGLRPGQVRDESAENRRNAIRRFVASGATVKEAAEKFGVSKTLVVRTKNGGPKKARGNS